MRIANRTKKKFCYLSFPSFQCCGVCNKQFANVYRLQRHMISHDESAGLRRFKCADCGKAFKFKHHLKVGKKEISLKDVTKQRHFYFAY